MTARTAEVLAVSAISIVLTLVVAAPVLRAPSDRIFGMDLVGHHHDPFTMMQQIDGPGGGLHFQPFTDIPGALLARASGPVAAYNWLVLLTFPLSAAAAYLLARHLRLAPASAALAALAYAFSPFHLAHAAYHPHIAQTQWLPLYFLALWRCLDRSTPAALALLAASAAGVVLSNFYGGLIAAVLTPVAIGTHWLFTSGGEPGSTRRLAATTASLLLIAGAGILYAWSVASAAAVGPDAYAFTRDELFLYSAKWWSYLVPPVANPVLGPLSERIWSAAGVREGLLEQQVSLGWGVVLLGIIAVWGWAVRRPSQASLAAVPVLAVIAMVALFCSLSPERTVGGFTFTRPSAILYELAPMFRAYARFGVVVQLMAVLLAAMGAERLWRTRMKGAQLACVMLVALAAGEYAVWVPALWRDVWPTAAHRWIAAQPDRVLAVDCAPVGVQPDSIRWLSAGRIVPRPADLEDCTEPRLADKLSAAGYTHLLVRLETDAGRRLAGSPAPEGVQRAARFADAEVFVVTAPAPVVHTGLMTGFYPREYDKAGTWRWMRADASWTVVNRSDSTVLASCSIEIAAFDGPRRLTIFLDGAQVQTLTVPDQRGTYVVGPLSLSPGSHHLAFHSAEPPTVADDVLKNGDPRALSFRVGAWEWTLDGEGR